MLDDLLDITLEFLNFVSAAISIFFLLTVVFPFCLIQDLVEDHFKKDRYKSKEVK
jgi:hypothetical protein